MQTQQKHRDTIPENKITVFTYNGKEAKKSTELFEEMQIRIEFPSKNAHRDRYGKNGVYQMKCMDCPLKYIGQTGRTFYSIYKEHT
jgi:hypothetical protein